MSKIFKEGNIDVIADFRKVLSDMSPYIIHTPLITIPEFNKVTGHDVFFKLENLQVTGSFKIRGVLNYILNYFRNNPSPKEFNTYGTGNHGAALAWAGQQFNFISNIFLSKTASKFKMKLIKKYNGNLYCCDSRKEAEKSAHERSKQPGNVIVPTADNIDIIVGAATILYETVQESSDFDAVFLPIGGGSLASGSLIVKEKMGLQTKIFAGEPKNANDVAISLRQGKLFRFDKDPDTIADAAKSLGITNNIYERVKELDGIYEISEQEILYWTNYFTKISNYSCEPTSSIAIAAGYRWLQSQNSRKKIVIIISGDNVKQGIFENTQNIDPKHFYETLSL